MDHQPSAPRETLNLVAEDDTDVRELVVFRLEHALRDEPRLRGGSDRLHQETFSAAELLERIAAALERR